MKLQFSPEQDLFRLEVRQWLAANVPKQKLPTYDTKEGRAKNRRTEIILTPKLDELFKLLESN